MSKAKTAAILYKNEKVQALNDFYLMNKEIIDEFLRLKQEVHTAGAVLTIVKINHALRLADERLKPKDELY